MPSTTPKPATAVVSTRLQTIADYLRFRSISVEPREVLAHLEATSIIESLEHLDSDYDSLIDRFAEMVDDFCWPAQSWRRDSARLFRETLQSVVTHIEQGRIDGRAAKMDDDGNGCILQILADAIEVPWQGLRLDCDSPLPIERFIWHVRPGETHRTCVALALVRLWTLHMLGLDSTPERNLA